MAGSVVDRATAKVGPLPVWAWALVLLVGGYLAYRFLVKDSGGSSSSSATPATQATDAGSLDLATTSGDTGSPPASGQGGPADNMNADLYGYLTGLQGSVDSLTALVQTSPAFWPGGESDGSGSGSTVPNGQTPAPPAAQVTKTPAKPAAKPAAPSRYYTYAPGKAPKNQKQNEAPGKGPAGTTLHFKQGKGYYYA